MERKFGVPGDAKVSLSCVHTIFLPLVVSIMIMYALDVLQPSRSLDILSLSARPAIGDICKLIHTHHVPITQLTIYYQSIAVDTIDRIIRSRWAGS
jgi:hypothetical protein